MNLLNPRPIPTIANRLVCSLALMLMLVSGLVTPPAMALELPKASRADHRVRYATYNQPMLFSSML